MYRVRGSPRVAGLATRELALRQSGHYAPGGVLAGFPDRAPPSISRLFAGASAGTGRLRFVGSASRLPYRIEFTRKAREHFAAFGARERALLGDGIRKQLTHQPTVETRNRKPLRPSTLAGFRLRIQNLRAYYDVVEGRDPLTLVQAIGIKVRNRVIVGGEEIEL